MNQGVRGIVIDPGHGGTDSGAVGNGIVEKDLNLKISEYMYDRFRELGIPVVMTRTTDETVSPSERVDRILDAFGNNKDVIVISNHINADATKADGAEVIYALRNNNVLSELILEEIGKEGQNTRSAYQRRLPNDNSKDYYFIHRNTGVTQPVIVEYGFLDSNADDPEQLKRNYKRYAEAVVRAVLRYLNLTPGTETTTTYTVAPGDSLWSIARKYNVTVDALKSANGLTSNVINIGQVLRIPSSTTGMKPEDMSGIIYVVAPGDTLWKIAKLYGVTVDQIKKANNLTSDNLSIGQEIKVPTAPSVPPTSGSEITYTVKSGDSLYKIANQYNITVDQLKAYNNLTSDLLSIGQVLRIPKSTQTVYVVEPGDSLYKIANRFGTTVDAIRKKNNLTTDVLSIGQKLYI